MTFRYPEILECLKKINLYNFVKQVHTHICTSHALISEATSGTINISEYLLVQIPPYLSVDSYAYKYIYRICTNEVKICTLMALDWCHGKGIHFH